MILASADQPSGRGHHLYHIALLFSDALHACAAPALAVALGLPRGRAITIGLARLCMVAATGWWVRAAGGARHGQAGAVVEAFGSTWFLPRHPIQLQPSYLPRGNYLAPLSRPATALSGCRWLSRALNCPFLPLARRQGHVVLSSGRRLRCPVAPSPCHSHAIASQARPVSHTAVPCALPCPYATVGGHRSNSTCGPSRVDSSRQ